jgi:hypothetical protein
VPTRQLSTVGTLRFAHAVAPRLAAGQARIFFSYSNCAIA